MERKMGRVWAIRGLVAVALVALITAAAVTWRFTDVVETEFLTINAEPPATVEILEVGGGRVVLAESDAAARPGVWGIFTDGAYGQLTTIGQTGDGRIERGLVTFTGSFSAGDVAGVDRNAFPIDPRSALGMPFEDIRVPGDLGVNPAWLISGEDDTWVVFVHGRDGAGRRQALRSVGTFRKLGLPTLVVTYRNDLDGGVRDGSPTTWGLDEWRDIEVALDSARLRGANDFVLVGHDLGAAIVMTWLHESPSIGDVRGVVLDSPILDLESLIDREAEVRGYPSFIVGLGKGVSRIRFGLEFSGLDQLERSGEFDPSIPILLVHGTEDAVVPITHADEFAAKLGHVRYEKVDGAPHGGAWNVDPGRYEDLLTEFISDIKPGLQLER